MTRRHHAALLFVALLASGLEAPASPKCITLEVTLYGLSPDAKWALFVTEDSFQSGVSLRIDELKTGRTVWEGPIPSASSPSVDNLKRPLEELLPTEVRSRWPVLTLDDDRLWQCAPSRAAVGVPKGARGINVFTHGLVIATYVAELPRGDDAMAVSGEVARLVPTARCLSPEQYRVMEAKLDSIVDVEAARRWVVDTAYKRDKDLLAALALLNHLKGRLKDREQPAVALQVLSDRLLLMSKLLPLLREPCLDEGATAVADPALAIPALSSQRASIEFNLERCRAAQR